MNSPAPDQACLGPSVAWLAAGLCLDAAKLVTELMNEDVVPAVVLLGILSANVRAHDRAAADPAQAAAPFTAIERRPVSVYRLAHNLDLPYETARRHAARLVAKGALVRDGQGVLISPTVVTAPAADICAREAWAISARLHADLLARGAEVPTLSQTPDPHEQRRVARLANEVLLAGLKIATEATATDLVTAMVFLAIYRANHTGRGHDDALANPGPPPGKSGPEAALKPVSVYKLSHQMRLPYETVRRHAGILLDEDLCLKAPKGGLIVPLAVLESEAMITASTKAGALLTQFVAKAFGPAAPESPT